MAIAILPDQAIFDNIFIENRGLLYGRTSGMHKVVPTLWTASSADDLSNLELPL